jgi:hypothetical protein
MAHQRLILLATLSLAAGLSACGASAESSHRRGWLTVDQVVQQFSKQGFHVKAVAAAEFWRANPDLARPRLRTLGYVVEQPGWSSREGRVVVVVAAPRADTSKWKGYLDRLAMHPRGRERPVSQSVSGNVIGAYFLPAPHHRGRARAFDEAMVLLSANPDVRVVS